MTNWYYDAMLPRSRTRTLISTYVTVAVAGATLLSIAGYADGARTPSFDEKHEIVRTAAGFEPALLTIPVGTTVTFTTGRDEQFWRPTSTRTIPCIATSTLAARSSLGNPGRSRSTKSATGVCMTT